MTGFAVFDLGEIRHLHIGITFNGSLQYLGQLFGRVFHLGHNSNANRGNPAKNRKSPERECKVTAFSGK
jgi:hypothetical protein